MSTLGKIACVVVFIALMVALRFGMKAALDVTTPEFLAGMFAGGGIVGFFVWIALAIDRRDRAEQKASGPFAD